MRDHIARGRARRVAAVLAAAAAPAERPVPGEAAARAAYREAMAVDPAPTRSRMNSRTTAAKITAAAALSALSLVGGGVAVAATGALPGTAQQTAKDALARVGVSVPGPADDAAEVTTTRGGSDATETAVAEPETTASTDASAHGDAVSELATTTDLEGADKGAAVSGLASDGKSKAGAHADADHHHGGRRGRRWSSCHGRPRDG